jgi:hypothetical protein
LVHKLRVTEKVAKYEVREGGGLGDDVQPVNKTVRSRGMTDKLSAYLTHCAKEGFHLATNRTSGR